MWLKKMNMKEEDEMNSVDKVEEEKN